MKKLILVISFLVGAASGFCEDVTRSRVGLVLDTDETYMTSEAFFTDPVYGEYILAFPAREYKTLRFSFMGETYLRKDLSITYTLGLTHIRNRSEETSQFMGQREAGGGQFFKVGIWFYH